ncbi:MAG: phosphoglucosamine mutase [Bacteroidales bacterium]|nr:phosphoglucosamine mutase [Bacteroidales bacterium]
MTLIASISGIRGTIGGRPGQGLTPFDIIRFTSAFATWALHQEHPSVEKPSMVVGRDARISGDMVESLVCQVLRSMGIDVYRAGLATTPTVEIAVPLKGAIGGIIVTASHNPAEWNALKLLNRDGEFISAEEGNEVLLLAGQDLFDYSPVDKLGRIQDQDFLEEHIRQIIRHPLVDLKAIKRAGFRVVVDPINSVGAIAIPALLKALGVEDTKVINGEPNGHFAHNPEPLPEHLVELSKEVVRFHAHLGISVDPDVDRLALVSEDGSFFGEEYTLVAVADYVLANGKGAVVSNLSSSRALRVVAERHGCEAFAAPVGEVNVVAEMKKRDAVIGGEGNGGVIFPSLHFGRDSLIGVALFLSHLARNGLKMTELRKTYPNFFMAKHKIELPRKVKVTDVLNHVADLYRDYPQNSTDGLKVDFPHQWFHLRKSNTEPIIRIYTESSSSEAAEKLAGLIERDIKTFVNNC